MSGFKNFEYKNDINIGIVDKNGNPQGNFLRVDISEGDYFVDNSRGTIIYRVTGKLSPDRGHITATEINSTLPKNRGLVDKLLEEYNKALLRENTIRRIEEIFAGVSK